MQVLCLEYVLKSYCGLRKTLCGVINQDFSCILMLQRGVFEDLVRNTIVNVSLPQLRMEV